MDTVAVICAKCDTLEQWYYMIDGERVCWSCFQKEFKKMFEGEGEDSIETIEMSSSQDHLKNAGANGKRNGGQSMVSNNPYTNPPEEAEQKILAQWLDLHQVNWFHPPNGGDRNVIVGRKLKLQGVKRGVPDVIIVDPPPACPANVGVAIELKRRKGGSLTLEQKEWLNVLEQRGWAVAVCKGADEAIRFLESLGYGKRSAS